MPDPSTPTPAFDPDRQVSQLTLVDRTGDCARVILETTSHIEAPNWSPDGAWLLCNGGGRLLKMRVDGSGPLQEIPMTSSRFANNDHVLSPDGNTIYFTVRGGELYAVPWEGGEARRISNVHPPESPLRCYLHGVSPNGRTLVYVGLAGVDKADAWGIYTIAAEGGADECLLKATVPLDGPEYSPDGQWIYYNAEDARRARGHAQIYRTRIDGNDVQQITNNERVCWFPHVSPDGQWVAYLSYPPGTSGHPANRHVELRVMRPDGGDDRVIASLFGGQGTINVNSWSPDSKRLAYLAYPERRPQSSGR